MEVSTTGSFSSMLRSVGYRGSPVIGVADSGPRPRVGRAVVKRLTLATHRRPLLLKVCSGQTAAPTVQDGCAWESRPRTPNGSGPRPENQAGTRMGGRPLKTAPACVPTGTSKLGEWLDENVDALGRWYVFELRRNYCRSG